METSQFETINEQLMSLQQSIVKISSDIITLTNSIGIIQKRQDAILSNIDLILQLENQTQSKLASIFK